MSTLKITFTILLSILLIALASCNPTPDPEAVVKSWNDALNEGDVDVALEYLDDNAAITIIPPPAGMSGVFTGKEQIRAWYEGNAALNGFNELVEVNVTEIEDMVGIWCGCAMGDSGYHKLNQDGTFTVAWKMSNLEANLSATAEYWFEGTVFHVNDGCGHGTHEVKIQKEGDGPARLIFKLIEDPCGTRINDWKSGMRWVEQ